jgi:hypothetical protein
VWRNRILNRLVSLLWPQIDWLLRVICRIKPLRADGSSIISIELRRYNGRYITLDDGSEIKAGDQIIELHLNSAWFKRRREESLEAWRLPWIVLHCFAQDLNFLTKQIANGIFDKVVAVHGITFLYALARRAGFQVEELPDTLWKKCAQFYMAGLMRAYHLPAGGRLETVDRSLELKEVWLSRETLLKVYLY